MIRSSCCALVAHDGVRGQRGEPAADRQQRGHAGGGVLRVEPRDRLVGRASRSRRHPARGSTSCPRRRGDPAWPDRRRAARKVSILEPLVHARGPPMPKPCVLCMARLRAAIEANDSPDTGSSPPTRSSPRPISLPFAGDAGSRRRIRRTRPADVVDDASAVATGVSSPSCSGNAARVAGELEGFDGEDGGRGVMAVRGRRLRREPRDDHVRAELADHAHDVGEDGLPVPDPQRLLGSSSNTRSPSRA